MEKIKQNSKEYFRGLRIVHMCLILGQAFFMAITVYLIESGNFEAVLKELITPLAWFLGVVGSLGLLASHLVFNYKLKIARGKDILYEKMGNYRDALMVRYILLEGPSFCGLVFFMLTGFYWFLVFSLAIVAIFVLIRPTAMKAETDLQLNPDEVQKINDPEMVILDL
jgi:hypothetical protein